MYCQCINKGIAGGIKIAHHWSCFSMHWQKLEKHDYIEGHSQIRDWKQGELFNVSELRTLDGWSYRQWIRKSTSSLERKGQGDHGNHTLQRDFQSQNSQDKIGESKPASRENLANVTSGYA
jgi:hypothetical protein